MDNQEFELIKRAQKGSSTAFDQLVRSYDRLVYQVVFGLLGNVHDTQDVYQETFLRAYTNVSTFRFQSEFRTWLLRIAINQSINFHKKKRIKKWFSLNEHYENASEHNIVHTLASNNRTEDKTLSKEVMGQINHCLDALPINQRTAFTLKHIQGYKIKEIAEMMNCSENTVKSHLFRAIHSLKNKLEPFVQN